MGKTKITYSEVVNTIERLKLETRIEVVAYYIGFCGMVDNELFDHIQKAVADNFINA